MFALAQVEQQIRPDPQSSTLYHEPSRSTSSPTNPFRKSTQTYKSSDISCFSNYEFPKPVRMVESSPSPPCENHDAQASTLRQYTATAPDEDMLDAPTVYTSRLTNKSGSQRVLFQNSGLMDPIKIHQAVINSRELEDLIVHGVLKIAQRFFLLTQGEESIQSLKVNSLWFQALYRFSQVFGCLNHILLERFVDLRESLKKLDHKLLSSGLRMTNERDCSRLWSELSGIQDLVIITSDGIIDVLQGLQELQRWLKLYLLPSFLELGGCHSDCQSSGTEDDEGLEIPELVEDIYGVELSLVVFKNSLMKVSVGLKQYTDDIIEGQLVVESFLNSGRLWVKSLDDIEGGLKMFSMISQRICAQGQNLYRH